MVVSKIQNKRGLVITLNSSGNKVIDEFFSKNSQRFSKYLGFSYKNYDLQINLDRLATSIGKNSFELRLWNKRYSDGQFGEIISIRNNTEHRLIVTKTKTGYDLDEVEYRSYGQSDIHKYSKIGNSEYKNNQYINLLPSNTQSRGIGSTSTSGTGK